MHPSDDFSTLFKTLTSAPVGKRPTLLCVCPNSIAVVNAAISTFSEKNLPLLFVATLNQVDTDGGYTGWTPASFARYVDSRKKLLPSASPVYLCLDHGGPWKKRSHQLQYTSDAECLQATHDSIRACIDAGYSVLHLDATGTPPNQTPVHHTHALVDRTLELQSFAESVSSRELHFEAGTPEDSLGDRAVSRLSEFVETYVPACKMANLTLPSFYVGDIGTTLSEPYADEDRIRQMVSISGQHGGLLKAHYSDDISNKSSFPILGVGAANIGPGLSGIEYAAVRELYQFDSIHSRPHPFDRAAITAINRHNPESLPQIDPSTYPLKQADVNNVGYAIRYVWNDSDVAEARSNLYSRVAGRIDPTTFVDRRLSDYLRDYITAFRLQSLPV